MAKEDVLAYDVDPCAGDEDVFLEADWVVPISSPPIAAGGLLIENGAIKAVGPAAELRARHPEVSVRAFPGSVLLPGFVNVHTHLEYSAFRDFCRPCGFGAWMSRLLLARRKLTPEDFGISALWGAYECIRSGVTSVGDTSSEGWTTARAARAAGLRARVYLEAFGLDDAALPATMTRLEERLTATERSVPASPATSSGPLPELGVSPHAPYTVSPRLYREAARFALSAGLRLATHVAESPAEVEFLTRGTGPIADAYRAAHLWDGPRWNSPGTSPLQYVASSGALGPWMLAVHCVQIDEADVATLAETGTAVAHCPRSNQRLRCGVSPVRDLLGAGVVVGLGTDSLGSNDDLDMFAEMRAALAVDRGRVHVDLSERPAIDAAVSSLSSATVMRMATLEGARSLGWDHMTGSLEVGKRADVIAVRLPAMTVTSEHGDDDPVDNLVSNATAADVAMVMVDGRVIVNDAVIVERGPARDGLSVAFDTVRMKLGLRDQSGA